LVVAQTLPISPQPLVSFWTRPLSQVSFCASMRGSIWSGKRQMCLRKWSAIQVKDECQFQFTPKLCTAIMNDTNPLRKPSQFQTLAQRDIKYQAKTKSYYFAYFLGTSNKLLGIRDFVQQSEFSPQTYPQKPWTGFLLNFPAKAGRRP
jgi:hypothetical protein